MRGKRSSDLVGQIIKCKDGSYEKIMRVVRISEDNATVDTTEGNTRDIKLALNGRWVEV